MEQDVDNQDGKKLKALEAQKAAIENQEKELEKTLQECEKLLIQMALVKPAGEDVKGANFKTSIFRFIWLKLTDHLRKQAEFYKKGMGF